MYTRHNWNTDEPITAQKLNYIEDGVSSLYGGNYPTSLIIDSVYNDTAQTYILNKTWREIYENFIKGVHCVIRYSNDYPSLLRVDDISQIDLDEYGVLISSKAPDNSSSYIATSADGYPTARSIQPK